MDTNERNISTKRIRRAFHTRARSRRGTKARKLTRSSFIPVFPATAAGSAAQKMHHPQVRGGGAVGEVESVTRRGNESSEEGKRERPGKRESERDDVEER